MLQQELWQTYQSKISYHHFPHWCRISPSFLFIKKITCSQLCAETTTRWSSLSKVTKPRERQSWVLPQRNSPKTCCSWGCQGSSSMFHRFPFSFGAGQNEARLLVSTKKRNPSFLPPNLFSRPKKKDHPSWDTFCCQIRPRWSVLSPLHPSTSDPTWQSQWWSAPAVTAMFCRWPMTHRRLCTMSQGFNKNYSISNCNTLQTQASVSWVWSQPLQHG